MSLEHSILYVYILSYSKRKYDLITLEAQKVGNLPEFYRSENS